MGNKSSAELWTNVYKLQEREFLAFNDEVTEKVQMGELDNLDVKAMQKFEQDFKASINENRAKLVEALWTAYANKKGVIGREECRNIIKDALKEGCTHLPPVLVQMSEIETMRKLADKTIKLMTDKEARPMLEASLQTIRKDVAERVKNQLTEVLAEANAVADKLLQRLSTGSDAKTKEAKGGDAMVTEAKFDPKATVGKEQFVRGFHEAEQEVIQMKDLMESVQAQFQSFAEIEVRNIPLRVIKKLEDEEDEADRKATEGGAAAGAGAAAGGAGASAGASGAADGGEKKTEAKNS